MNKTPKEEVILDIAKVIGPLFEQKRLSPDNNEFFLIFLKIRKGK